MEGKRLTVDELRDLKEGDLIYIVRAEKGMERGIVWGVYDEHIDVDCGVIDIDAYGQGNGWVKAVYLNNPDSTLDSTTLKDENISIEPDAPTLISPTITSIYAPLVEVLREIKELYPLVEDKKILDRFLGEFLEDWSNKNNKS